MRQERQVKGFSDHFVLLLFSLHACASFKMEEFNKDYNPQGNHACAKRMIKRFAIAW